MTRYLSICSGIEAASVAWHPLGWKPAAWRGPFSNGSVKLVGGHMRDCLSVPLDEDRVLLLTEISRRTFEDHGLDDLESDNGLFVVIEDLQAGTFEILAKAASPVAGEALLYLIASAAAANAAQQRLTIPQMSTTHTPAQSVPLHERISEAFAAREWTPSKAAQELRTSRFAIHQLVKGAEPMTFIMALRLERAGFPGHQWFLEQTAADLADGMSIRGWRT